MSIHASCWHRYTVKFSKSNRATVLQLSWYRLSQGKDSLNKQKKLTSECIYLYCLSGTEFQIKVFDLTGDLRQKQQQQTLLAGRLCIKKNGSSHRKNTQVCWLADLYTSPDTLFSDDLGHLAHFLTTPVSLLIKPERWSLALKTHGDEMRW